MRRLDREDRNLRAAVDWALANDEPALGLRIVGAIWRWFQQRGRIREARALLAELLARPSPDDVRVRIAGLAAEGGLAYWMKDFPAARTAYEERLELATATGDPILLADAHYDLGFLSMVAQDGEALRDHEQRALELYLDAGDEEAATRARQALVLSFFLGGDYQAAADLEYQNLEVFRRIGSRFQVADSTTLLSAIHWRLGDPATAWTRVSEALTFFSAIDGTSGLARALAMVAIILLSDGDAEFGGRVAGAAYRMVREQGAMLAPVEVLHLPDPAGLATERFGADRAGRAAGRRRRHPAGRDLGADPRDADARTADPAGGAAPGPSGRRGGCPQPRQDVGRDPLEDRHLPLVERVVDLDLVHPELDDAADHVLEPIRRLVAGHRAASRPGRRVEQQVGPPQRRRVAPDRGADRVHRRDASARLLQLGLERLEERHAVPGVGTASRVAHHHRPERGDRDRRARDLDRSRVHRTPRPPGRSGPRTLVCSSRSRRSTISRYSPNRATRSAGSQSGTPIIAYDGSNVVPVPSPISSRPPDTWSRVSAWRANIAGLRSAIWADRRRQADRRRRAGQRGQRRPRLEPRARRRDQSTK